MIKLFPFHTYAHNGQVEKGTNKMVICGERGLDGTAAVMCEFAFFIQPTEFRLLLTHGVREHKVSIALTM